MRFLVTGGSGFIGSHLVDALLAMGADYVIVLDKWLSSWIAKYEGNRAFEYICGDVRDYSLLEHACKRVDVVYHLAAVLGTSESITIYSPLEVAEINIIGTVKLLTASKAAQIKKVIFASTPDVPWLNPYKITKRTSEDFCRLFYNEYGLNTIVLRLPNIYGPRERWLNCSWGAPYNYQKVVPTFIIKALQQEPLPIFGDGEQVSIYMYVSDAIKAMLLAAEREGCKGAVIPVGSNDRISVKELAKLIIQLTRSTSSLQFLPMRPGEVRVAIEIDPTLAEHLLGFRAEVKLSEGLEKTIAFYRKVLADEKL